MAKGWYSDAFSSDLTKIDTSKATTNTGNAMNSLGDAFSSLGTQIKDDELQTKKLEAYDSQMKTDKLNQEKKQFELDDAWKNTTQEEIDNAYLSNLDKGGKFDNKDGTIGVPLEKVSFEAKQKADSMAQKKFNDTAIKTATSYKDYDSFAKDNISLIESADGTTIQAIKDKLSNNKAQLSALKTQKVINDLNNKVDKAEIKALQKDQDKNFKYSENTGTKIVSLVKTSLGMDSDMFELDENKKEQFNDMVTGIDTISKEYNLEPNQAYKLWLDTQKKNESKKEEVSKSWKDYQ